MLRAATGSAKFALTCLHQSFSLKIAEAPPDRLLVLLQNRNELKQGENPMFCETRKGVAIVLSQSECHLYHLYSLSIGICLHMPTLIAEARAMEFQIS